MQERGLEGLCVSGVICAGHGKLLVFPLAAWVALSSKRESGMLEAGI